MTKKIFKMLLIAAMVLGAAVSSLTVQAASLKKPTITKLKQTDKDQVYVAWKAVSGAHGYEVAYKTGKGDWTKEKTSNTQLVISGLKKNKTYQFKVRAYKGKLQKKYFKIKGYGKYSAAKTVKITKMAQSNCASLSLWLSRILTRRYPAPSTGYSYYISNYFFTDKCIDVYNFAKDDGAYIGLWNFNNGKNQVFRVSKSNGYYVFESRDVGIKYIHKTGWENSICLWTSCQGNNPKWTLESGVDGYFYIKNKATNTYLTASTNGKDIYLTYKYSSVNNYENRNRQLWRFNRIYW